MSRSTQKPDMEMMMIKKEVESMKKAYACLKPLIDIFQKPQDKVDFSKTMRSQEANKFWDVIRTISKEHDQTMLGGSGVPNTMGIPQRLFLNQITVRGQTSFVLVDANNKPVQLPQGIQVINLPLQQQGAPIAMLEAEMDPTKEHPQQDATEMKWQAGGRIRDDRWQKKTETDEGHPKKSKTYNEGPSDAGTRGGSGVARGLDNRPSDAGTRGGSGVARGLDNRPQYLLKSTDEVQRTSSSSKVGGYRKTDEEVDKVNHGTAQTTKPSTPPAPPGIGSVNTTEESTSQKKDDKDIAKEQLPEKEDHKVQNRKLRDENSELRKIVEQEQNKIKELNEANKHHLQVISNFKKNYNEVCVNLQKEKKIVQDLLDTRTRQFQHIDSLENDVKKYQQDIDDRDRTIMSLGKDWESLSKEHNDLKSRSTVSPATCELSDPNRPTKLAEMFLELYNNEWRDCYTTITEYYESQTSVIQMLLRTCLKIYSHCQMIASEDLNALKRIFTLFGGDSDDNLLSQMKQRRRRNYQVDIDLRRVKTGTEEKMEDIFGPDLIKHKNVQAFWIKCLDICWRMVILNPPVIMDTEINKKGQPFDNAKFNPYTQSGHVIEFIVWPTLYTHQGGVILSKGIAQGFQKTDSVGGKRRK